MENQQVAVVKQQVTKALQVVDELQIITKDDFSHAVEVGTRIKQVAKSITDRKEEITKPLNEALKSARALFKPLEDTLDQAEDDLKVKMLVYKEEERKVEAEAQKKAEEAQAKIAEQLAKNEISQHDATKAKIDTWVEADKAKAEKTVKTDSGAKATEKFIDEYVVIDKTLIPLSFMEPNMTAIKQAFKDGQPVPGVELRKKAIISF